MSCPIYKDYTRGRIVKFPEVSELISFDICESEAYKKCRESKEHVLLDFEQFSRLVDIYTYTLFFQEQSKLCKIQINERR